VLLITLDTVRADHCSVYGYHRPTTPTLERVARAGVLFERAYAPMSTTLPSHASLFTALPPPAHGVLKNGHILAEDFETLAERLGRNGYDTAAIVSSFPLDQRFGLAQGFGHYDDQLVSRRPVRGSWIWEGVAGEGAFDQDARITTDEATEWLRSRRRRTRPFFLWVHYYDPHFPYRPARAYRGLFPEPEGKAFQLHRRIARYDAEIREMDDAIGRLLATLRAERREASTVLIVAADHGEGLMQHGWMHHGLQLYEESVRVPLLFRWPDGLPAGKRVAGPAKVADITPTILDLVGLPLPDGIPPDGAASLVSVMRGTAPLDPERPIYFQRRTYDTRSPYSMNAHGTKRAVRRGRWKYIEAPDEGTRELYDLAADPGERRNRVSEAPAEAAALATMLEDWRRAVTVRQPSGAIAPEDAAKLRALGYIQ
jgi:arylsulfatase A-like enzyme